MGLIPGWGTRIPHAVWQKTKTQTTTTKYKISIIDDILIYSETSFFPTKGTAMPPSHSINHQSCLVDVKEIKTVFLKRWSLVTYRWFAHIHFPKLITFSTKIPQHNSMLAELCCSISLG